MKILVIEDEPQIAAFIRRGLEEQQFVVDCCEDGNNGVMMASDGGYDAIVLDLMLPGRNGLTILEDIRGAGNQVAVIVVTARDTLPERLEGLNRGADDYITKPFHMEELVARIHAVTRRAGDAPTQKLSIGHIEVDLMSREVKRDSEAIELTTREYTLLTYLMRSAGRVVTRTQIYEHVWEYFFDPGTNVVDVYIKRLRQKLDCNGQESVIETVRGVGYRMRN